MRKMRSMPLFQLVERVQSVRGDLDDGGRLRLFGCKGRQLRRRDPGPKENGGVHADSAIPARALLRTDQGYAPRVIRRATASERPSVGPGRARDNEPARIP